MYLVFDGFELMGHAFGGEQRKRRIAIPINAIGVLYEDVDGTIIHCAAGFGQIKVSDSIDSVMNKMNELVAKLSGGK